MAILIYSAIASLDGYVEDERGEFGWAAPDEEVLAFVNDLERPIGTYLYGRRMYETMVFWETASTSAGQPALTAEYTELWRAAEKVVYSRTLRAPSSERTRIERDFEPASGSSRKTPLGTSRSAVPSSRLTRSLQTWSMRSSCSCARSSSAAESAPCRAAFTPGSNSSPSAASGAASFISATRRARVLPRAVPRSSAPSHDRTGS